jgi:RNA polymerase sigma-70 factor (ECF subfamily)
LGAEARREAFTQLVTAHHGRVYNLMLRMTGSPADAADLTQEAFLRAWRAMDAYDPSRLPLPWLYRIAVNVLRDRVRSARRHPEVPGEVASPGDVPGPEAVLVAREDAARLWSAVAALAPAYRLPLLLYYQHDLDVRQVAAALGLPVSIVKNRLFRARRMLRAALAEPPQGGAPWARSRSVAPQRGR